MDDTTGTREQREDREFEKDMEETGIIMEACARRLLGLETLLNENREGLAYNIAEIMVAAKNLYTRELPQFLQMEGYSEEEVFDALVVIRMHLLNLKDLIDSYEESFLASIACAEQEDDEDSDDG
jgi:hypothetical protein